MKNWIKKRRERRIKESFFKQYDKLAEPFKSQAKANYGSLETTKKAKSLEYALMHGFDWYDSKEGSGYWKQLFYKSI